VFTINQNQRSRSIRIGVHDQSESVFTLRQNTHYAPIEIEEGMDFEIWGRVMWSLKQH